MSSKPTVHGHTSCHVMVYLILMIDLCPVLDEHLAHIFMAFLTTYYERGDFVLSKLMYDDKNN